MLPKMERTINISIRINWQTIHKHRIIYLIRLACHIALIIRGRVNQMPLSLTQHTRAPIEHRYSCKLIHAINPLIRPNKDPQNAVETLDIEVSRIVNDDPFSTDRIELV